MNFIEKLKKYILQNNDFNIVNINGSYADEKKKNRYDEFSDIDLFVVTEKKDYYLKNPEWLNFYDKKFIYFNDPISFGIGTELRVAFADGLLVDIAIVNKSEFLLLKENSIFNDKIVSRGTICLKNDFIQEKALYNNKKNCAIDYSKPTPYELNRKIDEFWIDIANIYKYISRNDMFSAKYAFDRRITKLLIYVLELYTKMISPDTDTMFNGRNINKWLDINNMNVLLKINSNTDKRKMLQCIDLAIDLFNNIMDQVFSYYGFDKDNRNSVIFEIANKRRKIDNE